MAEWDTTCWSLIRDAADGITKSRDLFARRYAPVVKAYLTARWRGRPLLEHVPDAAQDVFLECFREGGALQRLESGRPGGFRAFFFGVVRNVARTHEGRWHRQRDLQPPSEVEMEAGADGGDTPSRVMDREWARAVMREAAELQADRAQASGGVAARRVELLRLRFQDGLPIRDIAEQWGVDAATLHHEYARARREFREALETVLASQYPGRPEAVKQELAQFHSLLG